MSFGFIIIRHVNSEITNLLWQECYACIRKFYTEQIVIIDDYSNRKFLTKKTLDNVISIDSTFQRRGELLPYYYFLKYKWFNTAVILHDSVFIQKPIKFTSVNRFLWHIPFHVNDNKELEQGLLKQLENNKQLLDLYNSPEKWYGCFGCMTVITHDMLSRIQSKYKISNLLNHITCRLDRVALERVIGVILTLEARLTASDDCAILGKIWEYCPWNFSEEYTFHDYTKDKESNKLTLPIVKIWSGR
jgi:hypothetical protein